MAFTYTTSADVSKELNGLTLNSSSTPTSTTVGSWIEEASAEVNLRTGTVWSTALASSEYHDYDGGGILRVYNTPIISVTQLLAESNGINATAAGWYALTEGRIISTDFRVYQNPGEIVFHGTQMPMAGFQNIAVSYTYGRTTTPDEIKRLTTLMTAKRVINTIVGGSATNEGGSVSVGTISVSDPSEFGTKRLNYMDSEIETLFNRVGKMRVFKYDRRY